MEMINGIKTRRSIRKFTDQQVPHDLICSVVDTAAYAPTWKNTQISRYIAIDKREVIDEIAEKYAPFNAYILKKAPMLVVQAFVKNRSGYERDGSFTTSREDGWQYYDCGICAQTFCLAAHEAGLGTVIMGIFDEKGIADYLQLPDDQETMALIAVGYPAQDPDAPKRKTSADLVKFI